MVNKKIIKIRKDLDKLDDNFLIILKKRAKLVDLVLKNKKYKKEIIDKLLIFKRGFPGNLDADILEGIKINVLTIIKPVTCASVRRKIKN